MASGLFVVFGVVLLLLCALVTVNMVMLKKPKGASQMVERGPEDQSEPPQLGDIKATAANSAVDAADEDMSSVRENRKATESAVRVTVEDSIQETFDTKSSTSPVEVLTNSHGTPRIFERPTLKYKLMAADVPVFANDTWKDCFLRLTEDPGVVGWIAFQESTLGASDSDYDMDFINVLTDYRNTLDRLRNEVGMSTIQEASVIGDEGKMWFITAVEDVWFALFVERDTNIEQLSSRLFAPVMHELTP